MNFITLIGALIVGLCVGLLGAGGSILTLPLLVFGLHHSEKIAVIESLVIVGLIAFVGMIKYARKNQVEWKNVLFLGGPGLIGAIFGAYSSSFVSSQIQLILFGILMMSAGIMMFKDQSFLREVKSRSISLGMLVLQGMSIGFLTGLIGAGGGFIIVPLLVLYHKISITKAVGTSLAIIALNASVGFVEHWYLLKDSTLQIHWPIVIFIAGIGMIGCLLGEYCTSYISQNWMKKIMGSAILFFGLAITFIKVFY